MYLVVALNSSSASSLAPLLSVIPRSRFFFSVAALARSARRSLLIDGLFHVPETHPLSPYNPTTHTGRPTTSHGALLSAFIHHLLLSALARRRLLRIVAAPLFVSLFFDLDARLLSDPLALSLSCHLTLLLCAFPFATRLILGHFRPVGFVFVSSVLWSISPSTPPPTTLPTRTPSRRP